MFVGLLFLPEAHSPVGFVPIAHARPPLPAPSPSRYMESVAISYATAFVQVPP